MGEMNHCPKHGSGYGSCVACAIERGIQNKRAYENGLLEQIQSLTTRLAESEAREKELIEKMGESLRAVEIPLRERIKELKVENKELAAQHGSAVDMYSQTFDKMAHYRKALTFISDPTMWPNISEGGMLDALMHRAEKALADPASSEGFRAEMRGWDALSDEDADGERYVRTEPVWADGHQRLISFGRNRSGQDSGELDFSIAVARVAVLSPEDKRDLVRLLNNVRERVQEGLA